MSFTHVSNPDNKVSPFKVGKNSQAVSRPIHPSFQFPAAADTHGAQIPGGHCKQLGVDVSELPRPSRTPSLNFTESLPFVGAHNVGVSLSFNAYIC